MALLVRSLHAAALLAAVAVAQTHTHGDMAGSVTTDSAVVWTRSSSPADVSVEYSTDAALRNATTTPAQRTWAGYDYTTRVPLTGLAAGTRYHYRTRIAKPGQPTSVVLGPIGTFVTAPVAAAPSRFVFLADLEDKAAYHMLDKARSHAPDLIISMGDYPYADGANTLADYWGKHRYVRDHAAVHALYRSAGVVATWDDHEVYNDWDATANPTNVSNATTAWKHYMPFEPLPQEIYHALRWGPGVELFVLDTRSHRGVNAAPDLPGKSLLGAAQLAWLKGALRASTSTFKVICTSVPCRFGATVGDSWNGYQRERQDLLRFLDTAGIENVVFLTADQHWAAVHHHREGVREFQTGPIATFTRTPLPFADPERRFAREELNYGVVDVDPGATPPALTVSLYGAGGLLVKETIRAATHARVEVRADVPEARFTMDGPAYIRDSNVHAVRERVEPGRYTLAFAPVDGVPTAPEALDVDVHPGADLRVAARWRDVPDGAHPVLFAETFAGPLQGFTILDEGTFDAPSAWFTDNGYLQQCSRIRGGSTNGADPVKPGTMALAGSAGWTDYTVTVSARSKDDDALGVVFRYRDAGNYYRFAWDAERSYQRLTSKRNGVVAVLAERAVPYTPHLFHDLRIAAIGARLRVWVDGAKVFDVTDGAHGSGRVGLYTWGSWRTEFDDLVVRQGEVPPPAPAGNPQRRPVLTSQLAGRVTELVGRHRGSAGDVYALVLSTGTAPGIPLSIVDPSDPRVLELLPDPLLVWSLTPQVILPGFQGRVGNQGYLRARIQWPSLPGTKGIVLYCGGLIQAAAPVRISEVIPSVEVVLP